jgi:hypothetical protein
MADVYQGAPLRVRDDLAAAHQRAWERLARPGTWWSGAERVAIAAETRHAPACALCQRRKAALSPEAVAGEHDRLGALPAAIVEIVHRVRTDPARLTRRWSEHLQREVGAERYVETVGIVATVVAIDTFGRGIGAAPRPLPAPVDGAPSRRRPIGAKPGEAWVPWLAPEDIGPEEAELYPPARRSPANIYKAMSLVPAEVRGFFDLVEAQYLPGAVMRDFGREYRAITHAQIELLAARVSTLNQCLY